MTADISNTAIAMRFIHSDLNILPEFGPMSKQIPTQRIKFDTQVTHPVQSASREREVTMRFFTVVTLLFAVFPSFAEERPEPVKFDFNQKGTAPQRVILPIKLASSEELDSLRLDLTLAGVESEQTEGQAGLLSGKLSTYRFDDTVDVEIRLGRDDGKPMLLIKAFAISRTDKGKEKRTPVSIGGLEAALSKNRKLTESLKEEIKRREESLSANIKEEREIDAGYSGVLALHEASQNPQEKAKLKLETDRMMNRMLFLRKDRYLQSKALTVVKKRNLPLGPQVEFDAKVLDILSKIQSKCTIHYKASARVGSDITVVAETR